MQNQIKMKKIKLTILAVLAATIHLFAQSDTIKIKTSAVCEMCKTKIEHDLNFEKGIKSAILDVESKEVTIVYNTKKTTPDKLRKAITLIGYDADQMPADEKAYNKLHDCCKKDGHSHN